MIHLLDIYREEIGTLDRETDQNGDPSNMPLTPDIPEAKEITIAQFMCESQENNQFFFSGRIMTSHRKGRNDEIKLQILDQLESFVEREKSNLAL